MGVVFVVAVDYRGYKQAAITIGPYQLTMSHYERRSVNWRGSGDDGAVRGSSWGCVVAGGVTITSELSVSILKKNYRFVAGDANGYVGRRGSR